MTPPIAASDSRCTAAAATAGASVTRLPLADTEWAGRYDAIDLVADRLHGYACEAASCSETCWMSWTGPAIAALDGAHVHTHHHTTGRRLVIEIDLPDDPDRRDDDCGVGGWCA